MVQLRVLTPDDWRMWRALRLAALADAPDAFGARLAEWEPADEERWRARLSIPGSRNVVAFVDDEPVGMASGVPGEDAGVVELISMWVAPPARGRQVGDLLVSAVTSWAVASGARELRLMVVEGNDRAAALYRRHGFRNSGEVVDDGITREQPMTKHLS